MIFKAAPKKNNTIAWLGCLVSLLSIQSYPAASFADSAAESLSTSNKQQQQDNLLLAESQPIPHRSFSLKACFDKADADNKEILVATSTLSVSQAGIVIAKAIPNPTYSMVYGWGPAWKLVIAGNGEQLGWSEEIQVCGKRTKKTEVARANYLQTAFQIEAVRFDVHNRVRRAYAELVAAHAYADLVDTQRAIAAKLLDISQKRFDAGKAPGSEVMQAKLALMQFDTQKNQAWGRLVQDSAQVSSLMGEVPQHQETIDVEETGLFKLSAQKNTLLPDPGLAIPPITQLLPAAWRERNDLKVAIQNAYANKKALTLAKTQRIPNPTVGFQYFYSDYSPYQFGFVDPAGVLPYLQGIYPNIPQLQTSFTNPNPSASLVKNLYYQSIVSGQGVNSGTPIPDIKKDRVPFQPGYLLSVQHETPIFYQYQGQIDQARATVVQQLRQNEQLRAQIAVDIVTAYESLQVARDNIKKFQQQTLPAAAQVAQLTRRGYELGKTDLATTILAQQQYQQLLSSYFDAVVAYQNAWADLEKAIGVPINS